MKIFKIKSHCIFIIIALFVGFSFSSCEKDSFKVHKLDIGFITNIDNNPVFSWSVKSELPDFTQTACRVVITDFYGEKVWDSGKLSGSVQHLKYNDNKLKSGVRYTIKVKVWQNSKESAWSSPKIFFTPINYPDDWQAEWISYNYSKEDPLPVFKKVVNELKSTQNIEHARLYIAAPGFYEAFLNGEKLGENLLNPAQTNYEDYTFYSVYNIELDKLKTPFVLGIMLGNGWYNQNVVWGRGMIYGNPVFIAQLVVKYSDGSTQVIGSDESWTWKPGPILYSNIYAGETYDANRLPLDWFKHENDSIWHRAMLAQTHPTNLIEQYIEPIMIMDSIEVKQIIDKDDGTYIFDFGQNFSGWAKIKIQGEKNQKITLRFVEELDANGNIDPRTTGIRATKVIQTQTYICKGDGVEVWEPKFTYFGFRYAEVEGLIAPPDKDLLKGIVVYSSLDQSGSFSSSEENINKLHDLAVWTIKGNLHGIPTDCPHREKCGWIGDAHAFAHALIYNYDAQLFLNKFLFDMRSSGRRTNKELYFRSNFQDRKIVKKPKGIPTMIVPGKRTSGIASPDWGTAMVQLPWYLYEYYADKKILNNFYPDMQLWIEFMDGIKYDGLIKYGLGDWCPPGGNKNIDCPVPLSSTAFHILDLKLMAQTAKVLGFNDDYKHYMQLHEETVNRFNKAFLDTINHTYGSQTGNLMALDIGIVPEEFKSKVAASLVNCLNSEKNRFIKTGIFGLPRLFKVLAENGYEDEVFRLLTKKGENSFAYMWENFDATTLWEVLQISPIDDEELHFRSHSHPMQAGYDSWFYSGIAGINPTAVVPGFEKIIFKPYLTRHLRHAEATYKSTFGLIVSKWQRNEDTFSWELRIPENSKADIYIPNYGKKVQLTINGKNVQLPNYVDDFTWLGEYGSGSYLIKMVSL